MISFERFKTMVLLCGGFWMIFGLIIALCTKGFLVRRYEEETDLLDTVFFREHAIFTRFLPPFHSSAAYAAHLLTCLWGWRIVKTKKTFRDIDDPQQIIRHFSANEIKLVKIYGVSGLLFILHAFLFYFIK